jgi:phosphodiesterase/alkaline phosphatase D-like protein
MDMNTRLRVVLLAGIFAALVINVAARMPGQNADTIKITQGPILEDIAADSAVVAWSTNVQGSTKIVYGTDPRNLTQMAEAPWGANGRTHRAKLTNLQPNTTYYFRVETGQAQGMNGEEVETRRVLSFTTTPPGAAPLHYQRPR